MKLFGWLSGKGADKTPARAEIALQEAASAEAREDVKAAVKLYEESISIYRDHEMRFDEAGAHFALAETLVRDSSYGAAFDAFEAAVEMYRNLGKSAQVAVVLRELGAAEAAYSMSDMAEMHLKESLELCGKLGDNEGAAAALRNLGDNAYQNGEYAKAQEALGKAGEIYANLGKYVDAAICSMYEAAVALAVGDFEASLNRFQSGLALFRRTNPDENIVNALYLLSEKPFAEASEEQVSQLLNAALAIFSSHENHTSARRSAVILPASKAESKDDSDEEGTHTHLEIDAAFSIASLAFEQDELALADAILNGLIASATSEQNPRVRRYTLYNCGSLAKSHCRLESAERSYDLLLETAEVTDDLRAFAYMRKGSVSLLRYDLQQAQTFCEESLELYKRGKNVAETARSLALYGLVVSLTGETDAGAKLLKEAISLSRRSDDLHYATAAQAMLGFCLSVEDPEYARTCLQEAAESGNATDSTRAYALHHLAELELASGEIATAYELASRSLATNLTLSPFSTMAASNLELCAHIAVEWGDIETAAVLLARAERIMRSSGAEWSPRTVERTAMNREKLQAELGEDDFKRATVEGENLSSDAVLGEVEALLEDIEPDENSGDIDLEDLGLIV